MQLVNARAYSFPYFFVIRNLYESIEMANLQTTKRIISMKCVYKDRVACQTIEFSQITKHHFEKEFGSLDCKNNQQIPEFDLYQPKLRTILSFSSNYSSH